MCGERFGVSNDTLAVRYVGYFFARNGSRTEVKVDYVDVDVVEEGENLGCGRWTIGGDGGRDYGGRKWCRVFRGLGCTFCKGEGYCRDLERVRECEIGRGVPTWKCV